MDAALRPEQAARLMRRATHASVATATLLILAKTAAWLMTGSVSVLASLVDSLMDVAASLINLFAVRYALLPADDEHRFGHGKSESLAGLGQAAFIAGSAAFLIVHAVDRLLRPAPLEALGVGLGVMAFAMVLTGALLAYQRHVVALTGSTAIRADSLHYASDLLTNLAIGAALGLAALGWPGLDPVFAIAVALYILWSAWGIGREAFNVLMDSELPAPVQRRILDIAARQPGVRGAHDLRTRQAGQTKFIQLHLELPAELSLADAHALGDRVAAAVRDAFPGADVLIHHDPAGPAGAGR